MDWQTLAAPVIALDVGGTALKSGVVMPGGTLLGAPLLTPIDSQASAQIVLGTFEGVIRGHQRELGGRPLGGVALGFPGPFDYAKGICLIRGVQKYEALYGLSMREAISHWLPAGTAVRFRNDAEAAIIGEAALGAGRGYHRVVGITLGTGLGSAFLEDGEPQRTRPGVPTNGELYGVPYHGIQADETFSVRGLTARLRAIDPQVASIPDAVARVLGGGRTLAVAFADFGAALGSFMDVWIQSFDAHALIVLGGLTAAADLYLAPLRARVAVPVVLGQLGTRAALLGAAALHLGG